MFFTTAINKLQVFFTDYSANATDDLPKLSIMLPITHLGDVDYKYMENYISELENECMSKLEAYLQDRSL